MERVCLKTVNWLNQGISNVDIEKENKGGPQWSHEVEKDKHWLIFLLS